MTCSLPFARARRSCAQLGYMEDPFVKLFVRRPMRRPTIINRGGCHRPSCRVGYSPHCRPPGHLPLNRDAPFLVQATTLAWPLSASSWSASCPRETDRSRRARGGKQAPHGNRRHAPGCHSGRPPGSQQAAQATPPRAPDARACPGGPQVVSLGAGSDTTFFQLASKGMEPAMYFEVDFPEVRIRASQQRRCCCCRS